MKILSLSLCAVLLLSSCSFSGDIISPETSGLVPIENEAFSLSLPSNWEEARESELVTPSQGELVLAYRASQERDGYYNNIIILKNENRLRETSLALMKNNINTLQLTMQTFRIIAEESLDFGSDTGSVIVFEGKYGPQTPSLHYIQTAQSCGDESYFMTISVGSDIGDYTRYYPLLESFRCN